MSDQSQNGEESTQKITATPNTKPLLQQFFATAVIGTFYLSFGFSVGYPTVFVPQLLEEQNCTDCRNIVKVTEDDTAWLVSVVRLIVPITAPIGGLMMDFFGRLNLIKIATIPTVIGWIIIAAGNSRTMLMFGRLLTGIPSVGSVAAITYVSEVSSPEVRGCLVAILHVYVSLGMLIMLVEGSLMHWRPIAWSCSVVVVLPIFLLMVLPESPSWLVFKNQIESAHTSLKWFNKNTTKSKNCTEELEQLIQNNVLKQKAQISFSKTRLQMYLSMFVKPTFYKPMIILLGLFILQQTSGSYIIALYAVTFIKNIGISIDPYLASVSLGVMRFISAVLHIWLTKIFNRRTLLFFSTIGMAISMAISAMYTNWILKGAAVSQWIPLTMLTLYVLFSMAGLVTVPHIMVGEVFPLEIRGVAQNIMLVITSLLMFVTLQCYYEVNNFFGASGLQYLFSGMSLAALGYCYVFVPETHNKTLAEIEDEFNGTSFLVVNKYVTLKENTKYGSIS